MKSCWSIIGKLINCIKTPRLVQLSNGGLYLPTLADGSCLYGDTTDYKGEPTLKSFISEFSHLRQHDFIFPLKAH